jgi:hypothetical protein
MNNNQKFIIIKKGLIKFNLNKSKKEFLKVQQKEILFKL